MIYIYVLDDIIAYEVDNIDTKVMVSIEGNIKNIEKIKDKVAYTLKINVIKDKNGNWKIIALSNEDIKKIL